MNVGDRIDGWKEIGSHIGRTERTARRWEMERRLPVRRTPGTGRSSVYAIKSELDAWMLSSPPMTEDSEISGPDATESVAPPIVVGETQLAPSRSLRSWRVPAPVTGLWLAGCSVAALLLLAVTLTTTANARRLSIDRERTSPSGMSSRNSPVPGVDEVYRRGLGLYELRTLASVKDALTLFTQATSLDPKFAPAWSSLANVYTVLGEYESMNSLDAYAKARDAAERALALDPSLAEPHATLGFLDYFRVGDGPKAEQEFRTALSLNPQSAMAHSWFGTVLVYQGRMPEAMHQFDQAFELDPHSTSIMAGRALALGLGGHRDEGLAILEKLNRDSPNPIVAHHLSMLASIEPRKVELYLRSRVEIADMEDTNYPLVAVYNDAGRRYASGRGGERVVWRTIADSRSTDPLLKAEADAALGRKDAAIALLDERLRKPGITLSIGSDPLLTSLHGDKRWPNLLARDGRPWSPQ